ncbi:MAG: 3-dehydroquinate synthase [Tidjanibacter sp.]|nr:3-dehydroquinate synthase [Tidjanibacter sp.]
MHEELKINFAHTLSSRVCVGRAKDLLPELLPQGARVVAVADRNVERVCAELGLEEVILIDASEENKSLATASTLWERLVQMGADRSTFLLGIGGGITTDLVGFVAATYMRGVGFGLVPTTLLAQVDATIGGKCGVNFGGYKNMVGCFAPASFVVCDVALLNTLGPRELRSGMAEVVKTAIIGDSALFELCEQNDIESLRGNTTLFAEVVRRAAAVKCDIVQRDLLEGGERRKLNLGHTLAHAIESLTHDYTHGEAVAIGLVRAAQMAVDKALLGEGDLRRIVAVLERYGLPTSTDLPEEALLASMGHDKKNHRGRVVWVLPTAIGHGVVCE